MYKNDDTSPTCSRSKSKVAEERTYLSLEKEVQIGFPLKILHMQNFFFNL